MAVLHLAKGCGKFQSQKYKVLLVAITRRRSLGWKAREAITVVVSDAITDHISLPPWIRILQRNSILLGLVTTLQIIYHWLTCKSQTRTWPPRHPDARISLWWGWNAMHQGVRGCPDNVLMHLLVQRSVTYMLWSPWDEATFDLKKIHFKTKIIKNRL